jgi:site-specific recombinase XerD
MLNKTISDKISNDFIHYLNNLGISNNSLKFYRSDLAHFTGWLLLKIRSLGAVAEQLIEAIPFINNRLANEYKEFLVLNNVANKTINRRLSTLRHLSRFFIQSQVLDFDFMEDLGNVGLQTLKSKKVYPIFAEFEKHLHQEKVSPNTIKNYLSDIKQFISWLEQEQQFTTGH